jgi:hypothetical protein
VSHREPKNLDEPNGPAWITPPPTQSQTTASTLADWIRTQFGDSAGGVGVLRDRKTVVVYWKGPPPAALRRLADDQPAPVTFQPAAFSLGELMPSPSG